MVTAFIETVERLLTQRRSPAIAGGFFRTSMILTAFGYFSGYAAALIIAGVLLAASVSLLALGLRYLEHRLSERELNSAGAKMRTVS
jgi:hypothetical protein